MNIRVTLTKDGTTKYPMHQHDYWEIMLYMEGHGYLKTEHVNYPFSVGTAIIVPPNTPHGSVSQNGFKNIAILGDFSHLLALSEPRIITDDVNGECMFLAQMIYRNRICNQQYLSSLCDSYIYCLLNKTNLQDELHKTILEICSKITTHAFDNNVNICQFLSESGYAEDYIRSAFKKTTGLPPLKFLTKLRIERACSLIDIYNKSLSLAQIATMCGYEDYIYFTKKFKEITGVSPSTYMKRHTF